jgi:uncharacterized protein YndB with AHSA1/START domain
VLTISRTVAAPPDVLWNLLVDTTYWPQWGPTVAGAELDGGTTTIALGSAGTVRPVVGPGLPFTVTAFEPGRSWSWRVAGVAATSHAVAPVGAGTRVTFGVPVWAPAYLAVCSLALRRLDRLASGHRTGHH